MQVVQPREFLSSITLQNSELSTSELAKYIKDGIHKINDKPISEILLTKDPVFLTDVLKCLGFNPSNLDFENSLTLVFWYLYYEVEVKISYDTKYFISTATNSEIIQKLGPEFKGTTNRASLIFTMYTGFLAPEDQDYTTIPRYQELLTYKNLDLYYRYLYSTTKLISPIRYIASQQTHKLEYVLKFDDPQLYDWCMQNEVIPFKFVVLSANMNLSEIYTGLSIEQWEEFKLILFSEIKKYEKIGKNSSFDCLSDQKLVDKYMPPNCENRFSLLYLIKNKLLHFRNYEEFYYEIIPGNHIIEREIRKHSLENPLIAFGSLENYNFWNIDELILSFQHNINFKYPDSCQIFTIPQIEELLKFLNFYFKESKLIDLINEKLETYKKINKKLEYLKILYKELDQNKINSVLLKLFYLGLYSRFWEGKLFDYPYTWEDLDDKDEEVQVDNIIVEEKINHHKVRENHVGQLLEEILGITDSGILHFLELIPRIQFKWGEINPEFGEENILEICKLASTGNFCLSHFSNIMLQSAYYIIVIVLGLNLNLLLKLDGCKYEFYGEKIKDSWHREMNVVLKNVEK
jgi:hypothetical protein